MSCIFIPHRDFDGLLFSRAALSVVPTYGPLLEMRTFGYYSSARRMALCFRVIRPSTPITRDAISLYLLNG